MLLVVDVGNTHTVLGALDPAGGDGEVLHVWRISTRQRTTDEIGALTLQLLALRGWGADSVEGAIVCCVVPTALYAVTKALRRYLQIEPLVVGSGVKTGLKLRADNPREIGADRIVNAVGAVARWGAPVVVVDFGTAITVDCVDRRGDYVGGAIAPGLGVAADALFDRAAMLPRVEVARPRSAIGGNTVRAIQSGLYHGYVGLVDNLVRACKAELGGAGVTCVATGGFSNLIGRACAEIDAVDEHLTLRGLGDIWRRNAPGRRPPAGPR